MATASKTIQNQLVLLGGRLRHARLGRKMTMADFALHLGISVSALRRMELGRPGVSIGRWAEVLNHLNGPREVDGLLAGSGPLTSHMHQGHRRGMRQRTV